MPFAAEEANAQTADCAQFDVFTPSSGTWETGHPTIQQMGNLSGTLPQIVATFPQTFLPGQFFGLRTSPEASRIVAESPIPADNIPLFDVNGTERQPNPGEIFTIIDFNGGQATGNFPEFRVYTRADNALGLTQITPAGDPKCAADLDSTREEFFLTDSWAHATTAATTHMGYALDCSANMIDDGTGLFCRPVMNDADCKELNSQNVFNADTNECEVELSPTMCLEMDTPQIYDSAANECMSCGDKSTSDGMNCDLETARSCLAMEPPQIVNENACIPCDGETTDGIRCDGGDNVAPPAPQPAAAADESDDEGFPAEDALIAYGGVFGVVLAAHFLWDGNPNAFAFSPDVGYSLTENGYAYNYGGRMDFHKDRWHLYWTAGQTNANGDFGDFRYSSGGSYAADFWTATFSENASGEIVDYDLSLSANYGNGVWKLSPVYRLHSRFEESENGRMESETTNSLNLEGILRANRWILRPSAGFQWRNADDFADNARFGFSAMRNL